MCIYKDLTNLLSLLSPDAHTNYANSHLFEPCKALRSYFESMRQGSRATANELWAWQCMRVACAPAFGNARLMAFWGSCIPSLSSPATLCRSSASSRSFISHAAAPSRCRTQRQIAAHRTLPAHAVYLHTRVSDQQKTGARSTFQCLPVVM
jgi:hypothetical protein